MSRSGPIAYKVTLYESPDAPGQETRLVELTYPDGSKELIDHRIAIEGIEGSVAEFFSVNAQYAIYKRLDGSGVILVWRGNERPPISLNHSIELSVDNQPVTFTFHAYSGNLNILYFSQQYNKIAVVNNSRCYENLSQCHVFDYIKIVDGKKFTFLACGSYNAAYISEDKKEIYKQPYKFSTAASSHTTDPNHPVRAVDVWNEINPTLPARLSLDSKGWIAPFVAGAKPTADEINAVQIDVFIETKRVIVDAYVADNFKKLPSGVLACIDIGSALLIDNEERSRASLHYWNNDQYEKRYYHAFAKHACCSGAIAAIINMTKALLYITQYSSYDTERSYNGDDNERRKALQRLKNNRGEVDRLANLFDEKMREKATHSTQTTNVQADTHPNTTTVEFPTHWVDIKHANVTTRSANEESIITDLNSTTRTSSTPSMTTSSNTPPHPQRNITTTEIAAANNMTAPKMPAADNNPFDNKEITTVAASALKDLIHDSAGESPETICHYHYDNNIGKLIILHATMDVSGKDPLEKVHLCNQEIRQATKKVLGKLALELNQDLDRLQIDHVIPTIINGATSCHAILDVVHENLEVKKNDVGEIAYPEYGNVRTNKPAKTDGSTSKVKKRFTGHNSFDPSWSPAKKLGENLVCINAQDLTNTTDSGKHVAVMAALTTRLLVAENDLFVYGLTKEHFTQHKIAIEGAKYCRNAAQVSNYIQRAFSTDSNLDDSSKAHQSLNQLNALRAEYAVRKTNSIHYTNRFNRGFFTGFDVNKKDDAAVRLYNLIATNKAPSKSDFDKIKSPVMTQGRLGEIFKAAYKRAEQSHSNSTRNQAR